MPPEHPIIRPAVEGDADRLAELSGQLGYPASPAAILDRLRRLAARGDQQVFVALRDGQVVGWAQVGRGLSLESGPQAELLGLVVDEAHRGRGLGQILVSEAEAWARAQGLPALRVRCNVLRDATHRFYRRLGFDETKRQVVFRKPLEPAVP
ncbi:MAG TPA: GNAT family N-acetyltransferase [Geothrix sp.]|nr:GNAT family N-acetyltransferase [Geothrix sp.]